MKPFPHFQAICASVVLLIATALSAQQYTFRQYGPSDGLTNLGINCLLQDHTGYLWVGTDNGLFRYDGRTFRQYGHAQGLPNSEIRSLAESPDGVLWAATQNGVARLAAGRFEAVDAGEKGLFLGLAFDSQGHLYLEHSSGLLRGLRDEAGTYRFSMMAPGVVGGLYVHRDDVLFRRDGDVWRLTANTTERIGSVAGLPADRWGAITFDSSGSLWVRSATHLYELPHGQTRFIDRSEGVPHALAIRLFADSHGRIFVSSNSGVVIFDGANRTFIDPKHGLPADVAAPVLVDRDESLWMGMRGGGLIRRLGHGEWLSWKEKDGLLNDSVWSTLHERDGRLWVGSSSGLSIFAPDGTLAHSWTSHNGLTGDSVFAITAAPSGEVFAGTAPAGITRFSEEGVLLGSYGAASGLASEQVNAIAVDRQNRLWAAASGGCFRSQSPIDGTTDLKFERVDIAGMPADAYYHDVQIDEAGLVWITTSSGLARFDGSRWRVFTERDGLKSADVSAMAVGHNEIWFAYRDTLGMARLRLHGEQPEITSFTQQEGLSSDLIYAIAFDHGGKLWASTDNGISVLDSTMRQLHWRHYGMDDGLIWDDGNDHALSVDKGDNVWIGTSRGLSRYSAPSYPIPDLPAAIVLTAIHGVSHEFQATDKPVLSHAQNSLLIQFSALNYSSGTSIRYRYRLLGYKTSWNETNEQSVHFESLPGGRYTFEVIAAGPNGLWSSVPARFTFSVKSPWWQSWWFIAVCILFVALVSRAVWRFRVRVLLAQKDLLERQVAQRTEELRESHRQLEEIAYYDVLTSLPNRRMFTEQFRTRLALSGRNGDPFALLLIDLDTFKQTNDNFGHDAGDAVLIESANLLRKAVRESDCVARLGGDEFAILLMSPTDPAGIEIVCKRIVDSFVPGVPFKGVTLKAACSIGIAVYPAHGDTQDSLFKSADIALYEAKRQGGSTCHRYSPELQHNAMA